MNDNSPIHFIAHRGLMSDYPENSLRALREAVAAGARYIEFDIQCSADGIPYLFHDPTLERTTGLAGSFLDLPGTRIDTLSAHEPARFGTRFADEPIPSLNSAVELLNASPGITAFVELKRHSLERHGAEAIVTRVFDELALARFRWIPISFELEPLLAVRRHGTHPIGWVLRAYDDAHLQAARELSPDFLFCNWKHLPQPLRPLWSGPWQWALYDTVDANQARELHALGADYIETAAADRMLRAFPPKT